MTASRTLASVLLLATGLGCLRPSPAVVYHTLSPLQQPPATAAAGGPAVEVMPVRLPELLRRPEMVVAQGAALVLSETHRWGNPLDQDMQRVLVADLALLLGSDAVVASPYGDRVAARYRVELAVQSCDARPEGELTLQAVWMVTRPASGPAVLIRRTVLREALGGPDAEALAAAHSRILGALAREIAAALKALPVTPP